jgi:hypothetical protein
VAWSGHDRETFCKIFYGRASAARAGRLWWAAGGLPRRAITCLSHARPAVAVL